MLKAVKVWLPDRIIRVLDVKAKEMVYAPTKRLSRSEYVRRLVMEHCDGIPYLDEVLEAGSTPEPTIEGEDIDLSGVATCRLVNTICKREGVQQFILGPEDVYRLKIVNHDLGTGQNMAGEGPIRILLVRD